MSGFWVVNINNLMPNLRTWALRLCIKVCLFFWLVTTASYSAATTVIYVANTDSQDISAFQLDEKTGQAKLVQSLGVGGMVMPMTHSKKQTDRNQPAQHLLYAAIRSEPYTLVVLAIDNATGHLQPIGSAPLVDSMANIALDQSGRYLFAASYGGNKVSVSRLDENGMPILPENVLKTGAHPHQITADPTSQFVYLSLLGEDRLDYFRLDTVTAKFQPILATAATLPAGSGPRHFVFSAQGNFLYLLNELSANLSVFKRDEMTGKTTTLEAHRLLPKKSAITPWAADIHMTPDGKFLYVTERSSSRVYGFKVNQQLGTLQSIGAWDTESQPRAFAISPSGRYLAAVGQKSQQMTIYTINEATGELRKIDRIATGTNPSWVEIISLSD